MRNFGLKAAVAFIIVLLTVPTALSSAQAVSMISGTVTDSEGAVISKAMILVHWDPSGSQVGLKDNIGVKEDLKTTTDAVGRFSISVPPGFYDLFVSSMAFSPACRKVRVKADKPQEITIRLRVDPVVSRELD